jgi:hypothetical protein
MPVILSAKIPRPARARMRTDINVENLTEITVWMTKCLEILSQDGRDSPPNSAVDLTTHSSPISMIFQWREGSKWRDGYAWEGDDFHSRYQIDGRNFEM